MSRHKFTVIVEYVPMFNVEGYDIHSVVYAIMTEMMSSSPRGAKCRENLSLGTKDGLKYLICTITLQNMKGTFLDKALVISEEPAVAGEKFSVFNSQSITCQSCEGKLFFDVGRSMDYNYHVCATCGAKAQTLTETGASA